MKNDLLEEFTQQIIALCDSSALSDIGFHIALSGGLDSVVLLHLFSRLREREPDLTISAHHINHGLSDNAASWRDFCFQLCSDPQSRSYLRTGTFRPPSTASV